jgi:hypothetical protein
MIAVMNNSLRCKQRAPGNARERHSGDRLEACLVYFGASGVGQWARGAMLDISSFSDARGKCRCLWSKKGYLVNPEDEQPESVLWRARNEAEQLDVGFKMSRRSKARRASR